jgi:hypothetical protein
MGKPIFTIKSRHSPVFGSGPVAGFNGEDITEVNKIALVKRTRGTETSQYPEEKTSTEIPLVVASERGPGQCLMFSYQKLLERSAIEGDSPVF